MSDTFAAAALIITIPLLIQFATGTEFVTGVSILEASIISLLSALATFGCAMVPLLKNIAAARIGELEKE